MDIRKFIFGFLTGFFTLLSVLILFLYSHIHTSDINLKNLKMKSLDGKSINVTTNLKQPIVINVWATWCAPCIAEFPDFLKVKNKFKNVQFYFLTDEKASKIILFNSKKKLDLKFVTSNQDFKKLGLNIRPITYFYDCNGKFYDKINGDTTEEELNKILTNLQKVKPQN